MTLAIVLLCIAGLVGLIAACKINAFAAFLLTALAAGVLLGMPLAQIPKSMAGLTTAGLVAPLLLRTHINPNLMVLAVGAGSLMFSHVNDSGFWLFKEYFNLSVKDTLRSWSVMEALVGLMGLGGVLLLNQLVTT